MNLQPLNDMILVRVDEPEKKAGSLFLPDEAQKATNTGVVLAVGPGKMQENGTRIPVGVKVGDHIYFKGWKVEPISDTEANKLMMSEDVVIGVLLPMTPPASQSVWDEAALAPPEPLKPQTGLIEPAAVAPSFIAATTEKSLEKYLQKRTEPQSESTVKITRGPIRVPKSVNADVANSLYGPEYGKDWEYVG